LIDGSLRQRQNGDNFELNSLLKVNRDLIRQKHTRVYFDSVDESELDLSTLNLIPQFMRAGTDNTSVQDNEQAGTDNTSVQDNSDNSDF
jgi:hypothetical protein